MDQFALLYVGWNRMLRLNLLQRVLFLECKDLNRCGSAHPPPNLIDKYKIVLRDATRGGNGETFAKIDDFETGCRVLNINFV